MRADTDWIDPYLGDSHPQQQAKANTCGYLFDPFETINDHRHCLPIYEAVTHTYLQLVKYTASGRGNNNMMESSINCYRDWEIR